jgi:hypothetical protein
MAATPSVVDGQYVINVTKPGTQNWHIVDQQGNIPLIKGDTYKISFEAKADNPNSMSVFLAKNYGDYSTYYSTVKTISRVMQEFTWTVTMTNASDLNCRFGFGFGLFKGNVYIDNVSIEKMAVTGSEPLTDAAPKNVNIFPNPTNGSPDVTIDTGNLHATAIEVYNLQGQLIYRTLKDNQPPYNQLIHLNLKEHNIGEGIYLVSFLVKDGKITQKLVVR